MSPLAVPEPWSLALLGTGLTLGRVIFAQGSFGKVQRRETGEHVHAKPGWTCVSHFSVPVQTAKAATKPPLSLYDVNLARS